MGNKIQPSLEDLMDSSLDLQELSDILNQFNMFEALRVERQELRHSDFLAFLLNPQANHLMGDAFLVRFLSEALPNVLDGGKFSDVQVRREWQHADIVLSDENRELAIIIENKIDSGEIENQLNSYWQALKAHHPTWQNIFGIYLTPSGVAPTGNRYPYKPIGYSIVLVALEGVLGDPGMQITSDVRVVIKHYVDVLRRHIVKESNANVLARQLYAKHKGALDFINQQDWQKRCRVRILGLIGQSTALVKDDLMGDYIRFGVKEWDKAPPLLTGEGWTSSHFLLLFVAENLPDSLTLGLFIGPGRDEGVREKLKQVARENHPPFVDPRKETRFFRIYNLPILTQSDYANASDSEFYEKLQHGWSLFINNALPQIRSVLRAQPWLWQEMSRS
jgi:hypothetical protein